MCVAGSDRLDLYERTLSPGKESMKKPVVFLLFLVIGMVMPGCSNKSAVEGIVVDGRNQPIANIKVAAKQVQPVQGYEEFETTTGPDGSFLLDGLHPASEYTIAPIGGQWATEVRETVTTPKRNRKFKMRAPITIRFMTMQSRVVVDTRTGLMWAPDPGGRNMVWEKAEEYVRSLDMGNYRDWRLPTRNELRELYDPSLTTRFKIDPAFHLGDCCAWSSELEEEKAAWLFNFSGGVEHASPLASGRYFRTLAVRSPGSASE